MGQFAQGSRTGLSFGVQTDFDTPATGNFDYLPYASSSLNLAKDRVQGTDIHPDRMARHDRHGNRSVAGDIAFDLRADVYDDLLSGLMFNDWDTDQLKFGATPKYFTVEEYASDIDQARLFDGVAISQAAFSIKPNQMVTTTLSTVGKDMSISSVEKTVNPEVLNSPFDAYSGALQVGDSGGGLTSIATVTGIDFTVNNSLAPTYVVGSSAAQCLEYGMGVVEGTITAYFKDLTLVNRFINEVESALSVSVNDPTGVNEYTFLFPRVKFNGADVPVNGTGSRIITIPFVSLYDATEESNLTITRPTV